MISLRAPAQLGLFALPLAAAAAALQDGRHIARVGGLAGFDWVVWTVVLVSGLLTAFWLPSDCLLAAF